MNRIELRRLANINAKVTIFSKIKVSLALEMFNLMSFKLETLVVLVTFFGCKVALQISYFYVINLSAFLKFFQGISLKGPGLQIFRCFV